MKRKSKEISRSFVKSTGLDSLDALDHSDSEKSKDEEDTEGNVSMVPAASTPPIHPEDVVADDVSLFFDFTASRIIHRTQGKLSWYSPSCHMMDYIVHSINEVLCDNINFKRATPNYHPYILRLYFGVLFWIQCLRAGNDVNAISDNQHSFLHRFLDNHPLESLAIPGPLLVLFQTLCSSHSPHFGKLYPRIPTKPGPARREDFIRNRHESYFMPNVPGIFALLADLHRLASLDKPSYPKRKKHIPVTETAAATFGYHTFGEFANRTDVENWSLVTPGLQYYCEADQRLNEAFSERYGDFEFRETHAGDSLKSITKFLHMKNDMAWFTRVKEVANVAASFFEESGTLANCSPHGMVSNQVIVCLTPPKTRAVQVPRHLADKRALYGFSYRLRSTAHNLPLLVESAAAFSQTHIRMFADHPFLSGFGAKKANHGPFWAIRPIGSSCTDDSSYLTIPSMVKRAMKSKGPT